ncbi:MAG: helix-turn-helix domain-containing protein [Thermoguttaceae bacterium]
MEKFTSSQLDFFDNTGPLGVFSQLFNHVAGVYVFIKDTKDEFIWMNQPLMAFLGVVATEDYLGKTDLDFSPPDLAQAYINEDRTVMITRQPILNRPWICVDNLGVKKWYLSSKFPLTNLKGEIKGTAGFMQDCTKTSELLRPMQEMDSVVSYIFEHYSEKISIESLASILYLSVSQFERRFKHIFQISAQDFIQKVRLDTAARMLVETDLSITQIALHTGFYDSSYFAKKFKKYSGTSPYKFRVDCRALH